MAGIIEIKTSTIRLKLITFVTLIIFDMALSTFVELSLRPTLRDKANGDNILLFFIQLSSRMMLLVWFIFLLWSTFLFKFGMIQQVVKIFKWTILIILIDLGLNALERIYRIVSSNKELFG